MGLVKSEEAKTTLQAEWNEADKRYLAVVEGHLPAGPKHAVAFGREPALYGSTACSGLTMYVPSSNQLPSAEAGGELTLVMKVSKRGVGIRFAFTWPMPSARSSAMRSMAPGRIRAGAVGGTRVRCNLTPTSGELLKFESPLPVELARLT